MDNIQDSLDYRLCIVTIRAEICRLHDLATNVSNNNEVDVEGTINDITQSIVEVLDILENGNFGRFRQRPSPLRPSNKENHRPY
jgi:hypothetical protein